MSSVFAWFRVRLLSDDSDKCPPLGIGALRLLASSDNNISRRASELICICADVSYTLNMETLKETGIVVGLIMLTLAGIVGTQLLWG